MSRYNLRNKKEKESGIRMRSGSELKSRLKSKVRHSLKSKLKICFFASTAYPLFNKKYKMTYGGAELQFYLIAKELAKDEKLKISFIVKDYGQTDREQYDNIELYKMHIPKDSDPPMRKLDWLKSFWRIYKKIDPDIIFTTTASMAVGVSSFFAKIHRKRHIFRTAHQMDIDGSYAKKEGIKGLFYLYGLRNADAVIVQNEDHKKILQEKYGIDATLVKNSFHVRKKNPVCNAISRKHVLWVGRCEKWKKPELFIKLAAKFPKEKFVMICPPVKDEHEDSYYITIKKHAAVQRNLKFIEYVEYSEIQRYFDAAKVFINTSDAEGFPNTFLQSGIAGTPIISLSVNPDDFLARYDCGYCAGNSLEKMRQQLRKLLSDNDLWGEKSRNMHRYVFQNHDIHKNVIKVKKILRELCIEISGG